MPTAAAKYAEYLDREWTLFLEHPERGVSTRHATKDLKIQRVLDIGSGAGQEMIPFAEGGAHGIGLDVSPLAGPHARRMFSALKPDASVSFVVARGEALPFPDSTFDVLICRVALPCMDNRRALSEAARVLRTPGVLLLKIHHARYYLRKLTNGWQRRNLREIVSALRVLGWSCLYHGCGRLPGLNRIVCETFQCRWLLRRYLRGMRITEDLADSNAFTPSLVIRKTGAEFSNPGVVLNDS